MSKYTAEQVRNVARLLDGESRSMLNEYAAQLREREAAKMVVTDEMVENAWSAFFDARQRGEYDRVSMRAALEAVSLMLASARPIDAETVLDEYVRICAAEHAEHAAAADRVDAMRRALAHAGAASARVPEGFDERKPKVPGYYLVRRFCLDDGEENRAACVEVRLYDDGTGEHLIVNLHEINTEDEPHGWYRVEDLRGEFQWLKLAAAPKPEKE